MKAKFLFVLCALLIGHFSPSLLGAEILLVHGNGKTADFWFNGDTALGHRLTSLYGRETVHAVTYLGPSEVSNPYQNYHRPEFYNKIKDALMKIPAQKEIILVTHSLGVTMTLATLEYYGLWERIHTFINIAGAIRGIPACSYIGPFNWPVATCNAENIFNPFIFGFYPSSPLAYNRWTDPYSPHSLRKIPSRFPYVNFITYSVGKDDEILCQRSEIFPKCDQASFFESAPNSFRVNKEGEGLNHFNLPHHIKLPF